MSLPDAFFPTGETSFLIPGPQGQLEALVYSAGESNRVAIICHPHPLFQGTMNNKVVYTLSRAFQNSGITAIRFNYRGVGKSAGTFGDSIGEIEDLRAVMAWVKERVPHVEFYLAGFSFGAYIAASGAALEPCVQLFSIAPAVPNQPYNTLPKITCPWVIIQGEADEVISSEAVYEWFERVKNYHSSLTLIRMPGASHFFHGELITLRTLVEQNLVK